MNNKYCEFIKKTLGKTHNDKFGLLIKGAL